MTTDMSPTGDLLVTRYFTGEDACWACPERPMCCSGMAQCYGQHTHVRVTFTEMKGQRRHGYLDFTKFIVVGDVAQSFLFVIVCSMCASSDVFSPRIVRHGSAATIVDHQGQRRWTERDGGA